MFTQPQQQQHVRRLQQDVRSQVGTRNNMHHMARRRQQNRQMAGARLIFPSEGRGWRVLMRPSTIGRLKSIMVVIATCYHQCIFVSQRFCAIHFVVPLLPPSSAPHPARHAPRTWSQQRHTPKALNTLSATRTALPAFTASSLASPSQVGHKVGRRWGPHVYL
jgi:hypothetical protein